MSRVPYRYSYQVQTENTGTFCKDDDDESGIKNTILVMYISENTSYITHV